jgi:hypothetical protein
MAQHAKNVIYGKTRKREYPCTPNDAQNESPYNSRPFNWLHFHNKNIIMKKSLLLTSLLFALLCACSVDDDLDRKVHDNNNPDAQDAYSPGGQDTIWHSVGPWIGCLGATTLDLQLIDFPSGLAQPWSLNAESIGMADFDSKTDSIRIRVEMGYQWFFLGYAVRVSTTVGGLTSATVHTHAFPITQSQTHLDLRFARPQSATHMAIALELNTLSINPQDDRDKYYGSASAGTHLTETGLHWINLPLNACSCGLEEIASPQ